MLWFDISSLVFGLFHGAQVPVYQLALNSLETLPSSAQQRCDPQVDVFIFASILMSPAHHRAVKPETVQIPAQGHFAPGDWDSGVADQAFDLC